MYVLHIRSDTMSKFEPLKQFLDGLPSGERRMTFSEVEKVLGFELPPSARRHRPWWSNNPSNSAMTKAWLAAGCQTEQVDMAGETLVFKKKIGPAPSGDQTDRGARAPHRSPYGGLEGTVRIAPGVDITEPTGEVWAAEQGRL
jgi:hypothetical protein